MRPIELIIAFLIGLVLVFGLGKNAQNNRLFIGPIFIVFWILQIAGEGFRWQSWGLVLASILVLAGMFTKNKLISWLGTLPLLISIGLIYLFPIPAPGIPSGPYAVGTTTYHLIDDSRQEIYAAETGLDREFVVQIWYPAEADTGEIAPWMPDIALAGPALAEWLGLPKFLLNHLKYSSSSASTHANPVQSAERYPLLIFSHGWTGFKEQNSMLMEELASQGYLVASINHTYGSILTVFPDGKAIPRNPDALPSGVPLEAYDIASNLLVKQWAGDIAFTLHEFETSTLKINDEIILSEMIDFSKIGAMGHSTGGGAALEFCYDSARCAAIFAMDPWVEPVSEAVRERGIAAPSFFLFSENWDTLDRPERNYAYIDELIDNSVGEISIATVLGTKHMDYSMLPLLSPVTEQVGLKGPIDGQRILEIMNAYAVTYFNSILMDTSENIAEIVAYPEVLFSQMPDDLQ